MNVRLIPSLLFAVLLICGTWSARAAEVDDETKRYQEFETLMTNAKLVGHFTINGRAQDGLGEKEEYTILSAKKTPDSDFWYLKARIKYGNTDVTLPIPFLEVKWAGDTPVMTLTKMTLPGLGTFSARIVIHEKQYAGIWQHGKFGGQMFGVIEKIEE